MQQGNSWVTFVGVISFFIIPFTPIAPDDILAVKLSLFHGKSWTDLPGKAEYLQMFGLTDVQQTILDHFWLQASYPADGHLLNMDTRQTRI